MLASAVWAGRSVVSGASEGPGPALGAGAGGERWGARLWASASAAGESRAASVGLCCAHTYGKALANFVRHLLMNYLVL